MIVSLNKLLPWLALTLIFPLVFLNGWLLAILVQYLQPLVTVFVLAALLAFILDYPVRVLQQRGVHRNYAVITVFLVASIVVLTLGITLLPLLLAELQEITKLLPQWADSGCQQLQAIHEWAIGRGLPLSLSQVAAQLKERLPDELKYFSNTVFKLTLGTIDSLSETVLTVVLTFYLLLDGERIWQGIFQQFPSGFSLKVQQSLQQNFQNYFIGQIALSLLVGFSMTLMFIILQVPYGWLFGLVVGSASLVPFGDVLSLGVTIILVASQNFWLGVKVLAAAVVIDQVIDQAIAPRLLGSFTGLRPVWVIVALVVGTKLGGLLGLLIAVPLASSIKSLVDGWQVSESGFATDIVKLAAKNYNNEPSQTPDNLAPESTSKSERS